MEKDLRDLAGYEVGYQSQLFESAVSSPPRAVSRPGRSKMSGAMAQPFRWAPVMEMDGRSSQGAPAESATWAMEGMTIQQVVTARHSGEGLG